LTRYWDFSLPSAEVHPTTISKLNTFLQLGLIGATLTLPLLVPAAVGSSESLLKPVVDLLGGAAGVKTIVMGLQGVVTATTVWSGASYIWTKDAVKILGDDEALKRKQGFRGRMVIGVTFGIVLAVTADLARRGWTKVKEDEEEVAAK
jgi:cardiolipin synthase